MSSHYNTCPEWKRNQILKNKHNTISVNHTVCQVYQILTLFNCINQLKTFFEAAIYKSPEEGGENQQQCDLLYTTAYYEFNFNYSSC